MVNKRPTNSQHISSNGQQTTNEQPTHKLEWPTNDQQTTNEDIMR